MQPWGCLSDAVAAAVGRSFSFYAHLCGDGSKSLDALLGSLLDQAEAEEGGIAVPFSKSDRSGHGVAACHMHGRGFRRGWEAIRCGATLYGRATPAATPNLQATEAAE